MKKYYKVLYYISIISTFFTAFGIIFSIQNIIFNLMFNTTNLIVVFSKVYLHQLIFIVTSLIFIKKYIIFDSPYKKPDRC